MRITKLIPIVVGTPWRNLTIVELHTDEGLRGVGEVRMVNHTDALLGYLDHAARTHVVGSDPFAIESLVQRMRHSDYDRAGAIVMSGVAAVEIACWDLVGKALGQPIYRLLGGEVRQEVKAYANGWYTVERTPEEFHAAAQRAVALGYRALKLDPFGSVGINTGDYEIAEALLLVEAVRDAIGLDAELFIEMHGRFSPTTATLISRELERYKPAWIEEPIPPENVGALAKVAGHSRIPIATGERIHSRHEFRELLERQLVDVIQPDITMMGGLRETSKLASWADVYYVSVAPHNVGGPISTAAALHFGVATPNFRILEHFNDFDEPFVHELAPGGPQVRDGFFALPEGPGLGIDLDVDLAAEHPRRAIHFNLFAPGWHRRRPPAGESRAVPAS